MACAAGIAAASEPELSASASVACAGGVLDPRAGPVRAAKGVESCRGARVTLLPEAKAKPYEGAHFHCLHPVALGHAGPAVDGSMGSPR